MDSDSREQLAGQLRAAVAASDGPRQQQVFQALDLAISDYPDFDEGCLQVLLDGLLDPQVLGATDCAPLINLLKYNVDLMSPAQRERVQGRLIEAYPSLVDPAALIVTLELLVECVDDASAMNLLEGFIATCKRSSPARALVPTGIIDVAQRTSDRAILQRAWRALDPLLRDPDTKAEAAQALARVEARLQR